MNESNLKWLKNGGQYLKAATPKGSKSRFGTDIRYNLLSMSLEGYIMAILDHYQKLPDNHTYIDLINTLEEVMPINRILKKPYFTIRKYPINLFNRKISPQQSD